ncbi:MAG: response regulator transcription factor [Elusimicrobia bacterium]|nr:response regulator transcription factor [Elusimicrobiota bacterium]MDE2426521.1 response regulator transcription factor [Elusimicrobiota bacterium]
MARILVVEDEANLARLLRYNLEKEGHQVIVCSDGESGLEAFRSRKPELVILDVMLPKLDGFDFCRVVRADCATPILMLTARKSELDRVLGLELGADDYVTKPFSVRELMARVKAILRRASKDDGRAVMRAGSLELDLDRHEARLGGKPFSIRAKEFEFLKCLLQAKGRVLTRDELLERVWGYDESMEIDTRTVDQHIARLREKLGAEARRIVTIKGVGYRLDLGG